jgi:hypothetical protein
MTTSAGRPPKYPWRTVALGQTFFVPGRTSTSLQHDAARYHRPRRFKCRKVIKGGIEGIRVMRIE